MHRTDAADREPDKFGPGKDGYTEGDPVGGIPATTLTADAANALQEEIANAIEGAGLSLNKPDNTQLLQAIALLGQQAAIAPLGYISGAELSNNGGDPVNDINIDPGVARSDDNVAMITLGSTLVKQLDAVFAEGTAAGGRAAAAAAPGGSPQWYSYWLIGNTLDTKTDVIIDDDESGSNIAADPNYIAGGFTTKRRIGWVLWDGASIKAFLQTGDVFTWDVKVQDFTAGGANGTAVETITVPPNVLARLNLYANSAGGLIYHLITAIAQTDSAPDATNFSVSSEAGSADTVEIEVKADSTSQVRRRHENTASFSIVSAGWRDLRGN